MKKYSIKRIQIPQHVYFHCVFRRCVRIPRSPPFRMYLWTYVIRRSRTLSEWLSVLERLVQTWQNVWLCKCTFYLFVYECKRNEGNALLFLFYCTHTHVHKRLNKRCVFFSISRVFTNDSFFFAFYICNQSIS